MSGRSTIPLPLRHLFRTLQSSRSLHTNRPRPTLFRASAPKPALHHHHHQRRHQSFLRNAQTLFRQSPLGVTAAVFAILAGAGAVVYANYKYQTYIIGAFHNYPEPVAKKLRKALYYTNTDVNPQEAVKFYRQALQVANEAGMDPFSDEVMGVKIQVAGLMEQISQWPRAVEVLERVRDDNLEWLRRWGEKESKGTEARQARTRILAKTVGISVKLGELYGHPSIWDREMAEERLVWAVETVLKEKQRRQNEGVKEEQEGPWMSDDETGAALEALAHSYEGKEQHYLATPLFLQALSLRPTQDCHAVVLMNNLASSLAQQSPRAARAVQSYSQSSSIQNTTAPSGPIATREQMVENARLWAQKALDVAGGIKAPERDEECEVGCAVAMHNLGEFAEMRQDVEEARRKYQAAVDLAKKVGFAEGVERGQERLNELEGGAGAR